MNNLYRSIKAVSFAVLFRERTEKCGMVEWFEWLEMLKGLKGLKGLNVENIIVQSGIPLVKSEGKGYCFEQPLSLNQSSILCRSL